MLTIRVSLFYSLPQIRQTLFPGGSLENPSKKFVVAKTFVLIADKTKAPCDLQPI